MVNQRAIKALCEADLLTMARYIYKEVHNRKFEVSYHFTEIAKALEAVVRGEITRLIINMPPRYGKTELAIKIFICWCLAKFSQSKFIHLSYSDDLALDNSSQTKEYIQSEAFQKFWKMELKKDAQGKKKWFNEFGGGLYATAAGGAVTGFGAGVKGSKEFSGAILIDDPIKPEDAQSETKRIQVNKRYNSTIRNRVNNESTPIIVIMQRLHEEDLSGFLLDGGSEEEWVHLKLPAIIDGKPLYPSKHTIKDLQKLKKADAYMYAGQYDQEPAPTEGGEWKRDWFEIVNINELPTDVKWFMIIDGAYTKETQNDPSGFQVGCYYDRTYYILSSVDQYLEFPELIKYIPTYQNALGVDIEIIRIEPKASGKSAAQVLRKETDYNVVEIKTPFATMSKIGRAKAASPYIESGRVKLIKGAWNEKFLTQIAMFPNAKHDEHIDLTSYGIEEVFINNKHFVYDFKLTESIPENAKLVIYGLGLKPNPEHYSLIAAYISDDNLYLDEILHTNNLTASELPKEIEPLVNKELPMIALLSANVEIRHLNTVFNVTPAKDNLLNQIKKTKEYNLHVTHTSLNLIKALESWYWKIDNTGNAIAEPEGKEPSILTAIRLIGISKRLWGI